MPTPRISPYSVQDPGNNRIEKPDACDEVLIALRKIIHGTDLHSKRISRNTGLTVGQIVILRSVQDLGEVTAKQISRRVSLSQGTVTSICDRLENRGLIERYRSKTDRRVVHTRLTREGKAALRKAPPLLQESFLDEFETLTPAQQNEIVVVLQKVARMMGSDKLDAAPLLDVGPVKKEGLSS